MADTEAKADPPKEAPEDSPKAAKKSKSPRPDGDGEANGDAPAEKKEKKPREEANGNGAAPANGDAPGSPDEVLAKAQQQNFDLTTSQIIKTLEMAQQALKDGAKQVESDEKKKALKARQKELSELQGKLTSLSEDASASLSKSTELKAISALQNLSVSRPIEAGGAGYSAESPVMGIADGANSMTLSQQIQSPSDKGNAALGQDVDYAKGVRTKLDLVRSGRDVTQLGPEDEVRYDIEDAERDVVELRRMRRQLRSLFGPNLYSVMGTGDGLAGGGFGSASQGMDPALMGSLAVSNPFKRD